MFQGFTEETTEFLLGVTFNNERGWFMEHKQDFEHVLHGPLKELTADTLALMQQHFPKEDLWPHISRIYRDARRVYGKGPYQDNMWFTFQRGTTKAVGPVFWFEITAFSYSYGMGIWEQDAKMMKTFREQIDRDPDGFAHMVQKLDQIGGYRLYGDMYKKLKGRQGTVLEPWYNRRSISVGWECPVDASIYAKDLPQRLFEAFSGLMPMYRFFRKVYDLASETQVEEF